MLQPYSQQPPRFFLAPSLRRRMASWLYESLLLFAVAFVGGLILSGIGVFTGTPLSRSLLQLLWLFLLAGYFVWFWRRGQTLPMKTWHVAVVDKHGRPLTRVRALTRYALSWLWVLPPLAATAPLHLPMKEVTVLTLGWIMIWAVLSRFHPERQFWHDILAGTRLVEAPKPAPKAAAH